MVEHRFPLFIVLSFFFVCKFCLLPKVKAPSLQQVPNFKTTRGVLQNIDKEIERALGSRFEQNNP